MSESATTFRLRVTKKSETTLDLPKLERIQLGSHALDGNSKFHLHPDDNSEKATVLKIKSTGETD